MQVALSSQLNGKCVELSTGPSLFSGVELPNTTPIKHGSRRNSWSSDGGKSGLFWLSILRDFDIFQPVIFQYIQNLTLIVKMSDKPSVNISICVCVFQRVLEKAWRRRTVCRP